MTVTARIENVSPLPRKHWASLVFQKQLLDDLPHELVFEVHKDRRWRAVRGRTYGSRAVVHVEADIGGLEVVDGTLVPAPVSKPQPFALHPWVIDDIAKLETRFGVVLGDQITWSNGAWTFVAGDDAMLRFKLVSVLPEFGMVMELWADVYSGDPVVQLSGKIVWSDRLDPRPNCVAAAMVLKCGEHIVFDYAHRHGIVGGTPDMEGNYLYSLGKDVPFNDGSGLPISGAMICFRNALNPAVDEQAAIRNLQAASHGPVLGVPLQHGNWLAHRHVPRVVDVALKTQEEAAWQRFQTSLQAAEGWFAQRPVGCSRTPGQTGAQEDFGATKGTLAMLRPRQLYRIRYGVQADLLRGYNHYEFGQPLLLERHPNWCTWNGVTHYSASVSPDRLGKMQSPSPINGWFGYDAQHRSQMNLAAYLALQDDPLMHDQVEHLLTTDFADYRRRYPNNGADSARGQGRPAGTWAALFSVTREPRLHQLLILQIEATYKQMMLLGDRSVMLVLSWIGPDGRVPVYVNGNLAPSVSLWEHALAIVGLYGAAKVIEHDPHDRLRSVLLNVADLLLRYSIVEAEAGVLKMATSIAWNNGGQVPGPWHASNPAILLDNGSGVALWIQAGLNVALEVWPDHPEADRARKFLQIHGAQDPSTSVGDAEWWAAVESLA